MKQGSNSPTTSESLMLSAADPYILLRSYMHTSKVMSKAYGYSESYYRLLYKQYTYPLVVLTAVNSVLAGLNVNTYVVMGLSLMSLILVGFNQAVAPKNKEHAANQVKTEFGEIHRNIRQFIYSNNRSLDEVKAYSEIVNNQINVWTALSPAISQRFMEQAKKNCAHRSRVHRKVLVSIEKK